MSAPFSKSEGLRQDPSRSLMFVVGDINGMAGLMATMLYKIDSYKFASNDKIIFLGNYVEGGRQSKMCVHMLKSVQKRYPGQVIALKGPSDYRFVRSNLKWMRNETKQGHVVIDSYRRPTQNPKLKCYLDGTLDIPTILDDREYLASLPSFYETNKFFFCSGGLDPNKELEDHTINDLIFNKEYKNFLTSKKNYGKIVVHGTYAAPSNKIDIDTNRINVNTAGWSSQVLSCAIIDEEKGTVIDSLQVNHSTKIG